MKKPNKRLCRLVSLCAVLAVIEIFSGCAVLGVAAFKGDSFCAEEGVLQRARKINREIKSVRIERNQFKRSKVRAKTVNGTILEYCLNAIFPFDYEIVHCEAES